MVDVCRRTRRLGSVAKNKMNPTLATRSCLAEDGTYKSHNTGQIRVTEGGVKTEWAVIREGKTE